MFGSNFSLGCVFHLDGYQVVIAVIQVIYNKTAKYCLNELFNIFFRKFIEKENNRIRIVVGVRVGGDMK